jgi:hypothetical protein
VKVKPAPGRDRVSALGGYTCARIARHSEYRLGAILAVLSTALGFLLRTGEESLLHNAALAGVRFGVSRNGKDRIRRQQLAQPERSA